MEMLMYYLGSCLVALVVISITYFKIGGQINEYFMPRVMFLSIFWPVLILVWVISIIFEKE